MDPLAAALLIFLAFSGLLVALYVPLFGSRRALQQRYQEVARKLREGDDGAQSLVVTSSGQAHNLLRAAAAWLPAPMNHAAITRLSRTLIRAGFQRASAINLFRVVRVASAASAALLGFIVGMLLAVSSTRALLFAAAGGAIGAYAPLLYLTKRASGRQRAIGRQLSDVLDLLVVCMEAGLGLFEAIKVVGEETERQGQAIGTELMLVAGEVAAGASLGQALRGFSDRSAVEDVRPLAATLIQSEQLGTQMAPALKASSDTLRTRRRLRAEEAAQKSTIKILFPLVLFVLPAMLIAILAPAFIQAMHTLSH